MTTQFVDAGDVRVTVQAACGNSVLQDSRVIRVLGESPDRVAWPWPLSPYRSQVTRMHNHDGLVTPEGPG